MNSRETIEHDWRPKAHVNWRLCVYRGEYCERCGELNMGLNVNFFGRCRALRNSLGRNQLSVPPEDHQ